MIRNLLFDMDNTLYPSTDKIETCMNHRMITFISQFTGLSYEEAKKERLDRLPHYGTTLEWLQKERNLTDVDSYFNFIHPESETKEISYDPKLRSFLLDLGKTYHMTVLTNAPMVHAKRTLELLDVYDLFDGIYDITANNFQGKPYSKAYLKPILEKNFTVDETLFIDDHPKYIRGYNQLGGKSVLIDAENLLDIEELGEATPYAKITSIYDLPTVLRTL